MHEHDIHEATEKCQRTVMTQGRKKREARILHQLELVI